MKANRRKIGHVVAVWSVLLYLAFGATGCSSFRLPGFRSGRSEFEVVPLNNRDVATLSSDDIVRIMRRSGFSDDQILQLGTEVRNGLLLSGAVQVRKKKVEAIFAVRGDYIYITTRLRGSFIYDLTIGEFGLPSASSPGL